MKTPFTGISVAVLALALCTGAALAEGQPSAPTTTNTKVTGADVLERPSEPSALAAKRLLIGMARAGNRLVAVGSRGHIVYSDDAGQSWTQAQVPVSSDLTAVCFPDATHGWAVGHDGVVLASTDAGATWVKQLDGRAANDIILSDVSTKLAADPESEELKALVAEAERDKQDGPDKPFLDVWFENPTTGFVVGAYNLILGTTDGGVTWQSWFDRVPNPRFMNLNAIRPAAGQLYIAGEAGLAFRLDREAMRFVAVPVDYQGSLFGIVDAGEAVLTFGLKGNLFRSTDLGASWTHVASQLPAAIVGGATLRAGMVILADQGGRLAMSKDSGQTFERLQLPKSVPLAGVMNAGDGRLGLTGPFGVMIVTPGAAAAP